jgi:serine O-acetyltransferase
MNNSHRARDLELAIDHVMRSYEEPAPINNLQSAKLPNKLALIEAYGHLKPALFMGYFSTRPLSEGNLRYSISTHLYAAFELLGEQIHRAVDYEVALGRRAPCDDAWCETVVLDLIRALPNIRAELNADCRAAFEGDPAANSIEEVIFSYPAIEAITAHRVAHVLYQQGVPMIPRIVAEHAHSLTGIDINPGARIGPGFFIDHGTGVVIGETTIIGRNVKMYQGVTLGALSVRRTGPQDCGQANKRHPTIEDNVTIYAGATILGGQTVIGAGSVIGGNTWIIKSVPPGSKVFGRPREE